MNTLDRYLIRHVLIASLAALVVLATVSAVFTFFAQLHNVGTFHYTIRTALVYSASVLPQWAFNAFPIAVLLGALFGIGGLASHHEIVAMRAAGLSFSRLAAGLALGSLPLLVLAALLGQYLAPPLKVYAETDRALALYNQVSLFGPNGIWLRSEHRIVNIMRVGHHHVIEGVSVYTYGHGERLRSAGYAPRGVYQHGLWVLDAYRATRWKDGRTIRLPPVRRTVPGLLDPGLFSVLAVSPSNLSGTGLWSYIRYLHANGLNATPYETAFWHKIASVCTIPIMILLALFFAAGPLRSPRAGQRLFLGILIGGLYKAFDATFLHAGAVFGIPPVVVAFLPVMGLLALALVLLWRVGRV